MAPFWGRTGLSVLAIALATSTLSACSGNGGSPISGGDPGGNTDPPPSGRRSTVGAQAMGSFSWIVDGETVDAPSFVPAKGPEGATRNFVSRHQLSHELSLSVYQRVKPGYGVALLELAIFNDPLVCRVQPAAAAAVPSSTLPEIEFEVAGSDRIFPVQPALSTFRPVEAGKRYRLQMTNPEWRRIADGAGMVFPFYFTTSAQGPEPSFAELQPLFPQNPGTIWQLPVNPAYPGKTAAQMSAVHNGYSPFDGSGDPWAVQGDDRKDFWSVGYHEDWKWCHLGAYFARGDRNDLLFVMPTVYRQAARPCHYDGLQIDFDISNFPSMGDQQICIYMGRPGVWGLDRLGRVPAPQGYGPVIAPHFMGWADDHGEDPSDTRLWTGPDYQHASMRRVSEYAMATGSPWAWQETLYYAELAKGGLRVMYQFGDAPRAMLAQAELAYRAYKLNPGDRSAVDAAIATMERFLVIRSQQPWYPSGGGPAPFFAMVSDQWIPGHLATALYQDTRAAAMFLKLGVEFGRPNLVRGALEVCQYACTLGYVPGAGIKRHVDAYDPTIFTPPDYVGFSTPAALPLRLAADYLAAHPMEGFDGNLYRQVSDIIVAQAMAAGLPGWAFFP